MMPDGPVNRVAGYFAKMDKDKAAAATDEDKRHPKTDARRESLKRNLAYEMKRAGLKPDDAEQLHELLLETGEAVGIDVSKLSLATVKRWLDGETGSITNKYRQLLADAFGYKSPRSILTDTHITRREKSKGTVTAYARQQAAGFSDMAQSFETTIVSSPEDTAAAFKRVMHSELSIYMAIATHWLDKKRR